MILLRIFIFLSGFAIFCMKAEAAGSGNQNANNLKGLCSATQKCGDAYKKYCTASVTTSEPTTTDGTLVPVCLVIENRLANGQDMGVRQQRTSVLRSISINHPNQQQDVCSYLNTPEGGDHLKNLIGRLERSITYLSHVDDIQYNAAIVGTRMIQAQLAIVFQHLTSDDLSANIIHSLRKLNDIGQEISFNLEKRFSWKWKESIEHIVRFKYFLKSPEWNSWKAYEILGSKEILPVPEFENVKHSHYDHTDSMGCFLRMIQDCSLTRECSEILQDPSNNRTTLIHNMMFFRLAIQLGCVNEIEFVNKFPNGDWQNEVKNHCSKMWNEANMISNSNFPTGFRSLFLNHVALCAYVGYPNFLRIDWMNQIMKWMDSTTAGCIPPDTKNQIGNVEIGADDLTENGEWCSNYETGWGVQILAIHLRHLLEACNTSMFGN